MNTNRRSSGLAIFLVGIALLVLPWAGLGILSLRSGTITRALPRDRIEPDGGKGFITPLRTEHVLGRLQGLFYEFPCDHSGGEQSRLRLFENDREIGPGHAPHGAIREFGAGRFSHWDRNLYFSTSDGGDAPDATREYRVETPIDLSRAAGLIALAISLVGAAIAWMSPFARGRTQSWRARWLDATAPLRTTIAPLAPRWSVALAAIWIACAAAATMIGRGEHGAYLLSTVPTSGFGDHSNALPGYAVFIEGVPRHQENMQTWDHVAMFNGARIAADMYANRPLYPFLVSCFAWALGVSGACTLVNLIAWALGTWAATRVGAEVVRSPVAGFVAGLLACVGPGWWFHVDDFSAHQLSFATSAFALLVLLRSRVWAARQPAEVHAAIAGALVIASLAYNSGLFFTATYALLAIWRNRWWHVVIVCFAAALVQRVWTPLLNLLSDGSFDYYAVERQLFEGAMQSWREWLRDGSWLTRSWDVFVDTLVPFAAVLPMLILGALAPLLGGVSRDAKREGSRDSTHDVKRASSRDLDLGAILLLLLTIGIPIAATIVYSPTATARGYLVFGASTAVWALVAALFVRLRPGVWRVAGVGCLLLAIAVQAFFVSGHARGDGHLVRLYMWGQGTWNRGTLSALGDAAQTEVLGLAGEASPKIGGGGESMTDTGAFTGGDRVTTLPAFKNGIQLGQMLVVRGVLILAIAIALHLLDLGGMMSARWWRRRGVAAISIAALLFIPPIGARLRKGGPEVARHNLYDRALPHRASVVTYEVDVDPGRLARLEHWRLAGASGAPQPLVADVLTGFGWSDKKGEGVDVEILAGGKSITTFNTEISGRRRRPIDLEALVTALRVDPKLRVVARRADGITTVASWQRGDLPGRRLQLDGAAPLHDAAVPAPILEIRVVPRERQYDPKLLLF